MSESNRQSAASGKSRWINIFLIAGLLLLVGLGVWLSRGRSGNKQTASAPHPTSSGSASVSSNSSGTGSPAYDSQHSRSTVFSQNGKTTETVANKTSPQGETTPPKKDDPWNYGKTPPVASNANPQVAAVAAAIEHRKSDPQAYARAVSTLAQPEKFDVQKYTHDPKYRKQYLNTPEPSRAFAPAQPGKDVTRLRRLSPAFQKVAQGKPITLRVRALPGAPVTFTSLDLGFFQNQLTTITVAADSTGVAKTGFRGPPGTISDVNILVASPVTSGQVRLIVHITRPS